VAQGQHRAAPRRPAGQQQLSRSRALNRNR
jgi:hypothetical protein